MKIKTYKKIRQHGFRLTSFLACWASLFIAIMSVAVNAQSTEKKISYEVPIVIPSSQAVASSAPSVYTAPAPVIRDINDAASVPPSPRSSADTEKKKKAVAEKKAAPEKNVAQEKKVAAEKKAAPEKKQIPEKKEALEKKEKPVKKKQTSDAHNDDAIKKLYEETIRKKPLPEKPAESSLTTTKKVANDNIATPIIEPTASNKPVLNSVAPITDTSAPTDVPLDQPDDVDGSALDNEINDTPAEIKTPVEKIYADTQALPRPREAFINEFQDYVESKIVPHVPGAALAIIADGKIKVLQAYGVKKVSGRDPINTDTTFRLASVSKTIAGTAAGLLVHDGAITWDTPIVSVLPNVQFSNPRYGDQLTLQHILSQSTGLPTHSGDNYIDDGMAYDDVLAKLKTINFVCPPGKCYAYQNVTFSLLSKIVAKKTGKTYEQYVKEKLFSPLGMRTASFGLNDMLSTNNYALPHVLVGRGRWYTETITENYYRINPAAGANASIKDMSRWVLAQMGHNPDVLMPSVLKSVHAKVTQNTPAQSHYGAIEGVTETYYGMGWRMFDYRGDSHFLHHGGYVLGFRSEMVFNPELQIGMVALTNSNKLPGDIIFKFLDAYEDNKRGVKKIMQPFKKSPNKK